MTPCVTTMTLVIMMSGSDYIIYPWCLPEISPLDTAPTFEEGVQVSDLAWRVILWEQDYLAQYPHCLDDC